MELQEGIKKALNEFGEIYLDKTEGWYAKKDTRTGGEDVVYTKFDESIIKKWDFINENGEMESKEKNITIGEIKKELELDNVTAEEVLLGVIINRSFWESKESKK